MIRTARDIAQEYLDKTEKTYKSAKSEYYVSKSVLLFLGFLITISSASIDQHFTVLGWSLQHITTFLGALSTLIQSYLALRDPHTEWLKKFRSYVGVMFELNRYDAGAEPYTDERHKDTQLVVNTENVIRSSLWSIDNREDGNQQPKSQLNIESEAIENIHIEPSATPESAKESDTTES